MSGGPMRLCLPDLPRVDTVLRPNAPCPPAPTHFVSYATQLIADANNALSMANVSMQDTQHSEVNSRKATVRCGGDLALAKAYPSEKTTALGNAAVEAAMSGREVLRLRRELTDALFVHASKLQAHALAAQNALPNP